MAKRVFPTFGFSPNTARGPDVLSDLEGFGSNPGNLRARMFVPTRVAAKPALVVVLHGCTQNAARYDAGAGWSPLAEELGFVLLLPEQRRANNPNLCFNWFSPGDMRREQGEALSIRQMIAAAVREHDIDPDRIFVTGLSAGGAMSAVMLSTYPEVFAGGAIIAGLPYGVANGIPQALERMRGQGLPKPEALAKILRDASEHRGRWPAVSIWHGDRDTIVDLANADAIVAQWRSAHKVNAVPDSVETVDGHLHQIWRDADGNVVIERYVIAGMGHGTPLKTAGRKGCGVAGPHMLDVGISSTRRIAESWGLTGEPDVRGTLEPARAKPDTRTNPKNEAGLPIPRVVRAERLHDAAPKHGSRPKGVSQIIEDALRAAGLMR